MATVKETSPVNQSKINTHSLGNETIVKRLNTPESIENSTLMIEELYHVF